MNSKERIGIYGGTFNPPHIGHLNAVRWFLSGLRLDKVIIVPAGEPPHKSVSAHVSSAIRYEMTQNAFEDFHDLVEVSDYEINKTGKSYTVDTLCHFTAEDRTLYLLCGTDMFLSLEEWKDYRLIFKMAKVVCMPREDNSREQIISQKARYKALYNADCIILRGKSIELSSTRIRELISAERDVSGLVPESVLSVIRRERLYE